MAELKNGHGNVYGSNTILVFVSIAPFLKGSQSLFWGDSLLSSFFSRDIPELFTFQEKVGKEITIMRILKI